MTINIYGNNVKSISWFNYVTTIIAGACYFYVYMFSPWWLVFNRYSITENFIEMANAITLTTSGVTSLTKFIFMKFYISHIRETIEKILQFDVLITPGSRFAINLQNNLKVVKKRAFIVWIFLITNGTIYAVTPFLKPGRNFAEDPYILYGLEPMLKSPNYEIAHVVTTIAIFFCVHLMVNGTIYVIVIVGYIQAQIFAISIEVTNLWEDAQYFYNNIKQNWDIHDREFELDIKEKIVNEYLRIRLRTIVHYHITNISIFQEINKELCHILAIEYIIKSVAIIAQLLAGLENTYMQAIFNIVLIYIDCLTGQKLIDACNEFEEALYSCEWKNFNVTNQKTILLMLLISQKSLSLSAGGIADLNFYFLMVVLKSIYSSYTTLNSCIQH
ncbi:uncharacterized protein LOC120631223 [Pararge aegeria]|uniref:uncharacterized protein LOC120631223 n=1 Tax=Pararge aegeria TaxID=116150 RepID=UPI0019CFE528|nr:uncharacterized protein LOC120631223 [Pararge aegeria]